MLLRFSRPEYIDLMIAGSKTTTIRYAAKKWTGAFRRGHDLHIYYGSRGHKEPFYVGKCALAGVTVRSGIYFTEADARADGFGSLAELKKELAVLNNLTVLEVEAHEWAILTFGGWKDGPNWKIGDRPSI